MVRIKLRVKVLVFTISIIVILLIISHLITSTLVASNLDEQLRARLDVAVDSINEWVSARKDQMFDTARLLSSSEPIQVAVNWEEPNYLGSQLAQILKNRGPDHLLVESTRYGWVYQVCDSPTDPGSRLPHRAIDQPDVLRLGFVTEVIPEAHRLVLTVSVPVSREIEVEDIGLLTLGYDIDAEALQNILFISGGDQIDIVVGDEIILSTAPEDELKQILRAMPDRLEPESAATMELDNETFLTRAQPFTSYTGETVAHLLIRFSDTESRQLLNNISNALNLSALGAFVVFSFISIVFSGRLTRHLNRLVGHVTALGEGRYEDPVEVRAGDEIGVLAGAFEDMRVKLKNRTSELVSANTTLDRRVKEIASLNNVMVSIASNLPIEDVFSVITLEASKHIPVEYAFLVLLRDEKSTVRLLARYSRDSAPDTAPPLKGNRSLAKRVSVEAKPVIRKKLSSGSEYVDEKWMAENGLKSAYFLPLLSEDTSIGAICFASLKRQKIDSRVKSFFDQLTTEITVALQRLRLNEELQLIESRLSKLFDSVRDGIFQTDPEGKLIFLNAAALAMLGAPKDETVQSYNLESMIAVPKERKELLARLRKFGYVTNFPASLKRTGGTSFDAELSVNFTDEEKGKRGIEGIIRDVTKRRRLERKLQRNEAFLRQIVEGTTNAIFTLDADAAITFLNPQLSEITGYSSKKLKGMRFLELISADTKETGKEIIKNVLENGATIGGTELKLRRSDGTSLTTLLSIAPLTNAGEGRAAVGVISDITEMKKLEEQLIRSERLASMGQIAAGVAHEINNPLGIVLGFTQDLLSDKSEDDPDREPLRIIEQETERCSRVVKDLLDLARAREARREPVILADLLKKTITLFKLHFRDEKVILKTDFIETPPILGDVQQLQQIFMNVILNAIHSMEDKGTLKITLSPVLDSAKRVTAAAVQIEDTGRGISEENLQRIFDPFYSNKRESGSGLGLFIVHRLVEAHGGSISIESKEGRGTIFTISLPTAEELTN